ncbi:MAG: phosphatidylinositol-specific phospholipase C1-like protein [Microthrixaceae bacterium]
MAGTSMLMLVAACSSSGGGPPTTAAKVPVTLDQIQVLAAHNAYHLQGPKPLLDAITAAVPALTPTIEYSHPTLTEQLDLGVRSVELDLFEDPDGGRYAAPKVVELLGLDPTDPAMATPGLKVFHVQEVDYLSTCPTFVLCLTELRDWSDAHSDHLPIVVQLEMKDSTIPDPLGLGFVQPIPATLATFADLEEEVRAVLNDDRIVTPADVQGASDTLGAAIAAHGWPDVEELRGRFVFTLDDTGTKRALYRELRPNTRDRLLFVDAVPPDADAAFSVLNDPVADGARIRELVAKHILVRTRADADTVEARAGDTTRRDAAFASGAQIVSTDFERVDPRWPTYVVALPGGGEARCNPISAPKGCAL